MKFYDKLDVLLRSSDGVALDVFKPSRRAWYPYADADRAWTDVQEIDEQTAADMVIETTEVGFDAALEMLYDATHS